MRRLIQQDLDNIAGTTISGYYVEDVRIKRGNFSDSDHYGIILGKNSKGHYVTWQFHLLDDDSVSTYWGRYTENRETALRDFNTRDSDSTEKFRVTITETLELTVEIDAKDRDEAEQIVSDNWKNGEYVLSAENFTDVEFVAVLVDDRNE